MTRDNNVVRRCIDVGAILLIQFGIAADLCAKETATLTPSLSPAATRILSFPPDQRMGNLNLEPQSGSSWDPKNVRLFGQWEYFGVAQGDVRVPADRNVQLVVRIALGPQEAARLRVHGPQSYQAFEAGRMRTDPWDLSGLLQLDPNSVYWLTVDSLSEVTAADNRVLQPISHLTGLRVLGLYNTGVSDKGMEHLRPLRSLRALEIAESSITGRGLSVIMDLPALEYLGFQKEVTDVGIKQVASHPSLRWLSIRTGRIWGPGLTELAKLPHLERLCLVGQTGLTDQHIRCLEGLTRLRSLTLWGSACSGLTDASLTSIGKLRNLEELYFVRANPRFTVAGMAHLKGLTRLKNVDFAQILASAEGESSGDALARQLTADHPQLESVRGIGFLSVEGMKALATLRRLKSLYVVLKDRRQSYYGPSGISHLTGVDSLENLVISTGDTLSDADCVCLKSLGHLKDLTITGPVTDRGLAAIGELRQLENLQLSTISRSGLNQLNGLSNLQKLNVSSSGRAVRAPDTDELILDLSGLGNLRELHLGWLPLQDHDLAFLEHLPSLKQVFIDMETNSLTGMSLRHLRNHPELDYLHLSGLSDCTGEDLASLNGLQKLRSLHLTGRIDNTALVSLTGPASIESINIYTDQPIQRQTVTELTKRHPVIEYVRIEGVSRIPTRPGPTRSRAGSSRPRR